MEFELQQVLTHTVGFLITVWVLKRFAWGPLLGMMEERRNKIVGEFEQIEEEKDKVARLTADYESRLRDIESERRAKLIEAAEEGKQIASEIKAAAQDEIKLLRAKAKDDLDREIVKAKVQLRDEIVTITLVATEKVLHEKLDEAKHRDLIGRFIDNLEKA
jgi:F-type H+-transporting ATPase subunit b